MSNQHILVVTIYANDLDADAIEVKLNSAKDWLRYAPGCWLVQTKQSAATWYSRLQDTVTAKDALVFICELNPEERYGRLSPEAWTWLKKVRQQLALVAS